MQKILTIVIPTFNMEAYLSKCLNSLILSSEQMARLEVLVINDGSKDRSSEIAHRFEDDYPNTFRVIDKENGNYGSCVNRGLREAQGKYIKVLDADDWFDTKEFDVYLGKLTSLNVDLILSPFCSVNVINNEQIVSRQPLPEEQMLDFNSYPSDKIFRYSMHMVAYRTELLRAIDYHQTEGISYTDTEWTHMPLFHVKSFVYVPHCIYQYMIGREGQTMNPEILAKNIWKYEIICKSLVEYRKECINSENTLADVFCLQQVEFLSANIYRMMLVLVKPTKPDLHHLKELDSYLEKECRYVYDRLGLLPLKLFFPFKYVKFWRLTGCRFSFDYIRDFYRRLKYKKTGVSG